MWGKFGLFFLGYVIVAFPTYLLLKAIPDEDSKQVLLLSIPGVINGLVFIFQEVLKRSLTWHKLKHFFSDNPIHWRVILDFKGGGYLDFSELERAINKALDREYNVEVHHHGDDKLILMVGGVMVTLSQTSSPPFEAHENEPITLKATLEAESPLKTFKRKHYDKLIKRLIYLLTEDYDFTLKKAALRYMNIKPKFIEELEEKEMLKVTDYKVMFEKSSDINLYTKNRDLVCVGNNLDKCFMRLEALV